MSQSMQTEARETRRALLRAAVAGLGAPMLLAGDAQAHGILRRLFHRRTRCRPMVPCRPERAGGCYSGCNTYHYLCPSQTAGTGTDTTGLVVYYYQGVHCCLDNSNYSSMTATSPLMLTDCSASATQKAANCQWVTGLGIEDGVTYRVPGYPPSQSWMPHCFAMDRTKCASAADVGLPRKARVDFGIILPGDLWLPPEGYYDVRVGRAMFRVKAFSYLYQPTGTYFDLGVQVDETATIPTATVPAAGQREGAKALSFTSRPGRICFVLTADGVPI